jgi:hypothetical protein
MDPDRDGGSRSPGRERGAEHRARAHLRRGCQAAFLPPRLAQTPSSPAAWRDHTARASPPARRPSTGRSERSTPSMTWGCPHVPALFAYQPPRDAPLLSQTATASPEPSSAICGRSFEVASSGSSTRVGCDQGTASSAHESASGARTSSRLSASSDAASAMSNPLSPAVPAVPESVPSVEASAGPAPGSSGILRSIHAAATSDAREPDQELDLPETHP